MSDDKQVSGLAAALATVQAALPPIPKTKTATVKGVTAQGERFSYTYQYADLADISAAVLPIMGKQGLSFTCQPGERDDGKYGLAYQLLHASGELLDGWYPLDRALKIQQRGAEITYARRYCFCSMLGISAEEDDDAQGVQHHAAQAGQEAPRARASAGHQDDSPYSQEPAEGQQDMTPPSSVLPEIQALADLAVKLLVEQRGVEALQKQVYDVARAHRGWLTTPVTDPVNKTTLPLSTLIRSIKVQMEMPAAAEEPSPEQVNEGQADG